MSSKKLAGAAPDETPVAAITDSPSPMDYTMTSIDDNNSELPAESTSRDVCMGEPPQGIQLIGKRIEVACTIQDVHSIALWDSGSQVSLISRTWLDSNLGVADIRPTSDLISRRLRVEGVGQEEIPYQGYTLLPFKLGHTQQSEGIMVPFLVTKVDIKSPIIGSNVLEHMIKGDTLHEKLSSLTRLGLQEKETNVLSAQLSQMLDPAPVSPVITPQASRLSVPSNSLGIIRCKIELQLGHDAPVLFEPSEDWSLMHPDIKLHETLIDLRRGQNTEVEVHVTNKGPNDFYFDRNCVIGTIEEVQSLYEPEIDFHEFDTREIQAESANVVVTSEETTTKTFDSLDPCDVQEVSLSFYGILQAMQFPELTPEECRAAKNMLWEEREAFSQHPDDIGNAPQLQLRLNTHNEIPVQRNYNSIPKHLFNEVKDHVSNMLSRGWIKKSKSAWSSPVVITKKKNGHIRFCCDYRQLNKKTIQDKHPLPRVQETLDSLQGSSFFSVLDLSRAYYQGFMDAESREKTAFVTPWGFYEWIRIPFGLTNAVAAFQRFMEGVLEEERGDFALPYLDDTIVHSDDILRHIEQVRKVLRKFQRNGLKLNITKCDLFKREVQYLGRIVNKDGYRMDEHTVKAVRGLLDRKFSTVGEVRQLLGLLSFHRRHIQDFASIAKPLTDLLLGGEETTEEKKGKNGSVPSSKKIQWEECHQVAMETLVAHVTNPPDTGLRRLLKRILPAHGRQRVRTRVHPLPNAR